MKKIRFKSVKFRNFLSYGQNWQTLYFTNGLNIIQGTIVETEKSNGSGKSSLTELIPFALFGKTMKKINKGDVVNWYNGKLCEVQLQFTIDDVPYEIRRGIKPNKLELYIDGAKQPSLASAPAFQTQIEEEVIGMDFNTFQNLIYFSPNNTISIINAKKPDKRKFLESLFDLSVYSAMLETVNAKIKTNSDRIRDMAIEKDRIQLDIDRLQKEIENAVIPKPYKYRDRFLALQLQLDEVKKKEFSVSEDSIKDAERVLQECKDTLKHWEKVLNDATAKRTLHESMIARGGDIEEIKKKREDIENQIELQKKCVYTDLVEEDLADDLQKKELMKEELRQVISEIQRLDVQLTHNENQVTDHVELLHRLDTSSPLEIGDCDRCGQPITAEIAKDYKKKQKKVVNEKIEELRGIVEQISKKIKEYTSEKEELYEKIKVESERISGLQEDIRIKRGGEETLKRLQERLSDIEDITKREQDILESQRIIKEQSSIIGEAIGKVDFAEMDVEAYQSKYDIVKKKWDEFQKHKETVERLTIDVKHAHDYYYEMVEIADKINKEIEEKNHLVHQNQQQIDNIEERIKSGNNLHDYLLFIRTSLKDENVKRFAISALIPYLNSQTNLYLSESGFPYTATVDSWLDVTIKGLGVGEVSYDSLSGGESKCIDLAVQLACNDIASMLAKTSLDVMILDEVLDSSVDKLGVQALLNIIRVRQRTNNDSVYVITHRNEIDEFTFDSIVRIIQEDKFSRVEVE